MRKFLATAAAVALLAGTAQANDVFGIWQSQKNDEGKYLHIKVHACESDGGKVCGTIVGAFGGASDANVGKPIIWDMTPDGANAWEDGKIWKADEDEVYDSEMELNGDTLQVSGCILFGQICKSQNWPRVE